MVTLRGIVLSTVIALSLLGACRDVPVDDGSATVIRKEEPPYTPPRDSCPDCVTRHKRPSVRLMTVHYKYKDYRGFYRWDSLRVNLLDTSQVCIMEVKPQDGGMNIKLHIEAAIPFLGFGAMHEYWGLRDVVLNIPEIVVDGQGRCNAVDLRYDPLENENNAGVSVPYKYAYSKYGYPTETIKVSTGDRNHGYFKITNVDPRGRFIDARLEASFDFPETPFVYQYWGTEKKKVSELNLSLGFRLALNP